jgi:hypothetical protein
MTDGTEADGPRQDLDDAAGPPRALEDVDADRIEDLDVRDQLRRGEEPFERIMAAAGALPPEGVLRVRAIFEPEPLYGVLGGRGFEHWTERLGDEDWRVWFWRPDAG